MTQVRLPPEQAWTFARLPAVLDAHGIPPHAVLHVGAHHGEEVPTYTACGFGHITLVEPDPSSVAILHDSLDDAAYVDIIAAACVPEPTGQATLHLAERTVWSGLQPHPTANGHVVTVASIPITDLLAASHPNVLVLDTQGTELALLKATDLSTLDLVIVETTRRPGDGAALYDDTVSHMHGHGWAVAEEWVHDTSGYTDTVFIKAPPCA